MAQKRTTETDPVVSRRMAAVRSRNTTPELRVRRILRSMGYGYRVHVRDLPGRPDIVLRKYDKAVIEIRGCFWHLHECDDCRLPRRNAEFWLTKLNRNRERDEANERALRELGWRVLVLWECELGDDDSLSRRLSAFLGERDR